MYLYEDEVTGESDGITCREFCCLGGFTLSTGLRRITQLIAGGKLRKIGYGNGVNYEATEGNYGKNNSV